MQQRSPRPKETTPFSPLQQRFPTPKKTRLSRTSVNQLDSLWLMLTRTQSHLMPCVVTSWIG